MNNTRIIFASASFMGQYQLLDIAQNVLEAWPKLGCSKELLDWLQAHPNKNRVSLLDSGVFSTWSKGDVVDKEAYAEFLQHETLFYAWVGLDKIPGSPGVIPDAAMVEASAQETWNNFMFLVDKGLDPTRVIPVFHQNEDMKWLKKLVDFDVEVRKSGYEDGLYIGISPANDRTSRQRILWLEECMPYVTNADGSARIRFHGFGATSTLFLNRYPWFSADSTSWLRAGASGRIRLPKQGVKYPYYDSTVCVAMTKRSAISEGSKHFLGLSKNEKGEIAAYIEANGFTLEGVCADGKEGVIARQTINLRYWKKLESELNMQDNRWKRNQGRFI